MDFEFKTVGDKKELIAYHGTEETVTIPEGVTSIAEGMFNYLPDGEMPKEIILPNSLEHIGRNCFHAYADFNGSFSNPTLYVYGVYVDLVGGTIPEEFEDSCYYEDVCGHESDTDDYRHANWSYHNEWEEELVEGAIRVLNTLLERDYAHLSEENHREELLDEGEESTDDVGEDYLDAYTIMNIILHMFDADPGDEKTVAYIRDHISKFLRYLSFPDNFGLVQKMLDDGRLFTSDNIDACIQYMIDHEKHELQVLLMNYKADKLG